MSEHFIATPEQHKEFIDRVVDSQKAVRFVADMLERKGYEVKMPRVKLADKHENWRQGADDGDLFVMQRVEVKRLSVQFISAADWPYTPYFIVGGKHALDRARPKPLGTFVLNADMTAYAYVPGSSKNHWYVEQRPDGNCDGRICDFYFCPMEFVQFVRIT